MDSYFSTLTNRFRVNYLILFNPLKPKKMETNNTLPVVSSEVFEAVLIVDNSQPSLRNEVNISLEVVENKRLKQTLVKTSNFAEISFDVKKIESEIEAIAPQACNIIVYPFGNDRLIKVNTVSEKYNLVPNTEVFGKIRQTILDSNIEVVEKYTMFDYSKFEMELIFPKHYFYMPNGDLVFLKCSALNSYSSVSNHAVNFGLYRPVCTNGLSLPVKDYAIDFSGKHTQKLATDLQGLNLALIQFLNSPEDLRKPFDVLSQRTVGNISQRIENVIKAVDIAAIENSKFNTVNFISERIKTEMDMLNIGQANDWLIYNGINRYLYDDSLNNFTAEKRQKIDRALMMVISR